MKLLQSAALAAVIGPMVGSASATTLRFDILEARWTDPVGGNIIILQGPLEADFSNDLRQVAWGPAGLSVADASGYDFDAEDTTFEVEVSTNGIQNYFPVGEFTHRNNPINNWQTTAIDAVDLLLRADLTLLNGDEIPLGQALFSYTFEHTETQNNADPCEFADGDPVNDNGCADQVIIEANESSEVFEIDDPDTGEKKFYTLDLLGFAMDIEDAENGIFDEEFLSAEEQDNLRVLVGRITEVTIPVEVPVPAPLVLLGAGLLGLYGVQRWRRRG
jgi:hypothetical protein